MAEKLTVQSGRPQKEEGRLQKEIRVYDLLDRLGIAYLSVDHEAAFTMEACIDVEKLFQIHICKNLFLCNRQKTDFYLLLMPGDKKFKTKNLSAQIGSARLSFADESYLEEFLDITPGSVSVLGLMNDTESRVQLLIDQDILDWEYIGCHPCVNTSSLKLKRADLIDIILPAVSHEPIYVNLPWEDE